MEQNIKYTTDGKRVVVIGNLNSNEKILLNIENGEHNITKLKQDLLNY